jgi:tetratricopeptide (TPR) repeat protein
MTVWSVAIGQTFLPDSIQKSLAGMNKDSVYVSRLNVMSSEYLKRDPALARRLATYAGETAREINFPRGYARSLTVVGNTYWYEGIYEFAQNYYMLAARYYKNIHDDVGLGQVYNNIGEVNKKLGDHEKALDYLIRSVNLRQQDSTLALSYYNIAEVYLMKKDYPEAEKYVRQSIALAAKFNDKRSEYYDHWMNARIQLATKSFPASIPEFEKAVNGWRESGETRNLIQVYHDLAEAYRTHGEIEKASQYLRLAIDLEHTFHVPELRAQGYLVLARLDSTRGNYSAAYQHLVRHNSLKDSIYNNSKAEQIARVQAIYDTERMDHENDQLKTEKELRDQQLKSRETLLAAITGGLLIVGLLATILYQQRLRIQKNNRILQQKNEEINSQKHSIELQAIALMKLNEELQILNRTLETKIEERSSQLLLKNQKLAEYSFMNAHQLRAPVASILGLIQLLDQVPPEERDTILKHLKTCGDQLDGIILEISRNLESD